jgi:hypothetical protein
VAPNTGLGAGTYTAIITVGDGGINITSQTFTVNFTVIAANYGIALEPTGTYVFPAGAIVGYGAQTAKTVTVRNAGNTATGPLSITNSEPTKFTVSAPSLNSIAANGTRSFTVVPKTGLGDGTHTATITLGGDHSISANLAVEFTVTAANYSIALNQTGPYAFPSASSGYGTQTAKTVTVTNNGNLPTGRLNITKAGANPNSFAVSATSLNSIPESGTSSFTVAPIRGLAAGTYTAAITVRGDHDISKTFNVSFTVVGLTVTFNAAGGTFASGGTIATAQTSNGGTVSLPAEPYRYDYAFGGWYTEANGGGTAFTAATPVRAGITVYARWLNANASLAALSVSPGTLSPAFSPYTTEYWVTVPTATASITVNATAADGKARVDQAPNPVALEPGENTIEVRVTAADGTTTNTYTIYVTRTQPPKPPALSGNADLDSLTVSTGTLVPAFTSGVTDYTVLVPSTATSLRITATAADARATLTPLSPNPAPLATASTTITLTVTAEDGTPKAYTLRAVKTATPAVSVAITVADERIDLGLLASNNLSKEAYGFLEITAPPGSGYVWKVDGSSVNNNTNSITLYANDYVGYGTHSVLLQYTIDGVPYGCEVVFKVVR